VRSGPQLGERGGTAVGRVRKVDEVGISRLEDVHGGGAFAEGKTPGPRPRTAGRVRGCGSDAAVHACCERRR
jgi:hypothetical protein